MDIPITLLRAIKEKRAMLFLGAGASLGAVSRENNKVPMGNDLSNIIAARFLPEKYQGKPLAYNADIAISETSIFEVQEFIHDYFIQFYPAPFHLEIPNIPWRAIFSLNYDLIIERVYEKRKDSIQKLAPILSDKDDIKQKLKTVQHVPLYKLHGCITVVNDSDLPLILTIEQYIKHLKNRQSLFKSLYEQSYDGPLVYIGTSLQDPDIREIISKVEEDTNGGQARSYFVTPNPELVEVRYWASRKIDVLPGTFEDFLNSVTNQLTATDISLAVFREVSEKPIYSMFIKMANEVSETIDTFLDKDAKYIHEHMKCPPADPKAFYKGDGQGFSSIVDNLDVQRKLTDEILLNHVIDDDPHDMTPHLILTLGHAGSGKSVLMRRMAYEASVSYQKMSIWVENISDDSLFALQDIYSRYQKRIYLFTEGALSNDRRIRKLFKFAKENSLPISIFVSERNNLWNEASEVLGEYVKEDYEIRYLNGKEIDELIILLENHNSLGYLTDKSLEERKKAFIEQHGRQLLVVLHEATLGKLFSDIVYDEYTSIYPEKAKIFYRTICVLNQFGIKVRAGLVSRIHGIPFEQFKNEFFKPLDHIVIARYDKTIQDYTYEARHQHVAELVFERAFISSESRYIELMHIIECINIEYENDRESFRKLTNAKTLMKSIESIDNIHNLYNKAIEIEPRNAFIYQQMGILEINHDQGDLRVAKEYISTAQAIAPNNTSIKHSASVLERAMAKASSHELEKESHRRKAKAIAQDLLLKNKNDDYAYAQYINVCLDELKDALEDDNQVVAEERIKQTEEILEQAIQRIPFSDTLRTIEADFFILIKKIPTAISSLRKAFNSNKANHYVAMRLARYYLKNKETDLALEILTEALENNRQNKDLNFLLALTMMGHKDLTSETIHYHLAHSFASNDERRLAQFWFARSLYLRGEYKEALAFFDTLSSAPIEHSIKIKPKGLVWDGDSLKIYWGRVSSMSYNYAFITPDIGIGGVFTHSNYSTNFDTLESSSRVVYNLSFSFKGPVALNVRREQ